MKPIPLTLSSLAILLATVTTYAQDPLPSWNDTAPKKAIVAFVEKVTKEGSPDFVPPNERIATFDNDGTLWCEKPLPVEMYFGLDRREDACPEASGMEGERAFRVRAQERHEGRHGRRRTRAGRNHRGHAFGNDRR